MNFMKIFGAGVVVYVGMAACSAASDDAEPFAIVENDSGHGSGGTATVDANATGGSGGTVGDDSGGLLDALADVVHDVYDAGRDVIDAATDPVREADAQEVPREPTVVVRPCDIEIESSQGSGVFMYFARAEFPGQSVVSLSALRVVVNYGFDIETSYGGPGGYRDQVSLPLVKSGEASVSCGMRSTGGTRKAETVTFVLP